jgi:sugar phosphate isomerase/epimerase
MTHDALLRRCGVSNVSTPLWTVAEDAAGYAAAGFGAIGVWLHKLEQPRMDGGFFMPEKQIPQQVIDEAVAAVRDAGLHVSHIVLAGNYTDDEKRDAALEHTLHAIDITAAFEADCLIVNPGRLEGLERAVGIEKAASAIDYVLERRRADVRLALEPVIDWQSDFLNTLGQALDIVDVVDHPDLGVYPDTWHLWETGTYDEDMERAGDRIFGFHLNDGRSGDRHREIPGEGEMPLVDMVRKAEAVGYRGTYDVEYTTPMAIGATGGTFDVPYEDVLRRIATGTTRILAEAGVRA